MTKLSDIDYRVQTRVERLQSANAGMSDAARRGLNPRHTHHAISRAFCLHWLKDLHRQRLEAFRAMPRPKLPKPPASVQDCAVAAPITMTVTYLDIVECMSCREIVNDYEVVDGICSDCRERFATTEDDDCDFCDGSGWTSRWLFGGSGGYEAMKPCPCCAGGVR